MKRFVITFVAFMAAACASLTVKYFSDENAWQKAQDSLIRLHSGMQYESILMVRSRLADADAAVEDYASRWRIFPLDHLGQVQDARKGISYLSNALDWSSKADSAPGSDTDQADALALAAYPDVTSSIPRWCEDGQLAFDARVAVADFGIYGNYWIELAEGKEDKLPAGPESPLNPTRELQQCREQQEAQVKAQNDAVKARLDALHARAAEAEAKQRAQDAAAEAKEAAFLAKYPYEVELSSYYPCSFALSVDGQAPSSTRLNTGTPDFFRMQRFAKIEDASCDVYSSDRPPYRTPQTEIEVKVNGSLYSPKWLQEGKLDAHNHNVPYYRTTIAPADGN